LSTRYKTKAAENKIAKLSTSQYLPINGQKVKVTGSKNAKTFKAIKSKWLKVQSPNLGIGIVHYGTLPINEYLLGQRSKLQGQKMQKAIEWLL